MKSSLSKLFQSVFGCIKVLLLSRFTNNLNCKIEKEECVILGNGPSLNESISNNLEYLLQSSLVCVNHFCTSEAYITLKPNFYILQDTNFFIEDELQSQFYIDSKHKVIDNIIHKTTWNLNLLVPHRASKTKLVKEILKQNQLVKIVYYNDVGIEGFDIVSHFLFKNKLAMPRPRNVLIPAIVNSLNLGFRTIKVIGADHSWLSEITVNNQNEALMNQKHFYDENESKPQPLRGAVVRNWKMHEILDSFYVMFKSYWEIESFAKKTNKKIYNCSTVSLIDAFERKKLDEK
jgi:hypothetical protein